MRVMNPNSNINSQIPEGDIGLFPNPSSSSITITFPPDENSEPLVEIFDEQGNLIYHIQNTSNKNLPIDVSQLANGLYLVRITDGDKVYTKKFIRN